MGASDNQQICRYEDDFLRYVWKPHGIASSVGKQFSFLDYLLEQRSLLDVQLCLLIETALVRFGEENELGLLNRLDTATSGLLYFAKTQAGSMMYKDAQARGLVSKHYVADVYGHIEQPQLICTPLAHHAHLVEKMVVWRGPQDSGKMRGQRIERETYIEPLVYDEIAGITTLRVTIAQGARHQIRVHCASIGAPLVGDALYATKQRAYTPGILHLRSVGVNVFG